MLKQILKLLFAAIVAILVPDDNSVPPPWLWEAEEAAPGPSQSFGFSSLETAVGQLGNKTGRLEAAGESSKTK